MFWLAYGDNGPRAVLVQALLRLKGFDARINGIADSRLFEVVNAYRISRGFHTFGAVDGQLFADLIHGTRLKIVDSLDASGGDITKLFVQADKATGALTPLMNARRVGHGVDDAVDKILARASHHHVALLRFIGHGNEGNWLSVALGDPYHLRKSGQTAAYNALKADWKSYLDYAHLDRHRPTLSKLKPTFDVLTSVELHACTIAGTTQGRSLIRGLADILGVPVTGGFGIQSVAGHERNAYGESVPCAFAYEGAVYTAYPDDGSLASWAATVEASIPNLMRLVSGFKARVAAGFQRRR